MVQLANDAGLPDQQDFPVAQQLARERDKEDIQRVYLYASAQHDRRTSRSRSSCRPRSPARVWKQNIADRRPGQQARQVHGVLLLRVDLDAEQHEHPPQHLLQGVRAVRRCRSPRSTRRIPRTSGTGWTDSARRATSCSRSRTTRTSRTGACSRSTSTARAADRRRLGRLRDRNERLIEIKQIKGQSETHPILSPNDEFANYEIMSRSCSATRSAARRHIVGSYARQALKDGVAMQDTRASTRTRSVSSAAPTPTTPASLIARTISTAATP